MLPKVTPAHHQERVGRQSRKPTGEDDDDVPLLDDVDGGDEAEEDDVRPPNVLTAQNMDEALAWCEDDILQQEVEDVTGLMSTSLTYNNLSGACQVEDRFGAANCSRSAFKTLTSLGILEAYLAGDSNVQLQNREQLLERMGEYFEERVYQAGDVLFSVNDPSDALYFVKDGDVSLIRPVHQRQGPSRPRFASFHGLLDWSRRILHRQRSHSGSIQQDDTSPQLTPVGLMSPGSISNLSVGAAAGERLPVKHRIMHCTEGGVIGEVDFAMGQSRSFSAECAEDSVLYCLSRARFEAMHEEAPLAAALLDRVLLKSLSLMVSNHMDSFF